LDSTPIQKRNPNSKRETYSRSDTPVGRPAGRPTPVLLELEFDDTFVKPFHWSSISQAYTRVLHTSTCSRHLKNNGYGCVL